jgi:hypothetical protein
MGDAKTCIALTRSERHPTRVLEPLGTPQTIVRSTQPSECFQRGSLSVAWESLQDDDPEDPQELDGRRRHLA